MKELHALDKTDSSACCSESKYGIGKSEADIYKIAEDNGIIGQHPKLLSAIRDAWAYADSDEPVMIVGETGTGKELIAKFIHQLSGRKNFVPYSCSLLKEELAESKLFGHRKGSFTGADKDQKGLFEEADGGTLFLDELETLELSVQAKLLRALQNGEITPLGETKASKVKVRLLAATNEDPRELVKSGKLRRDLYYRLYVGVVVLPPLGERRSDIEAISIRIAEQKGKRLSKDALQKLMSHSWPGNIRELENALERSILRSRGKVTLEAEDLVMDGIEEDNDFLSHLPDPYPGFNMKKMVERIKDKMYRQALEIAKGNLTHAGLLLGVSAQAVSNHLERAN